MENNEPDSFNLLKEIFPNIESEVIWDIYCQYNFNIDSTIEMLLQVNNTEKPENETTPKKKQKKNFNFFKNLFNSKNKNSKKYKLIDNSDDEETSLISNEY